MSTEDIKQFVNMCLEGDSTILSRYEIILKYEEIAQAQLEEAKRRAKYMEEKAKRYLERVNGVCSRNGKNSTLTKYW
jgi:hypothetical protein